MDRLQKNCVLVSTGIHGLLAGALVFGAAFLAPSSKVADMEVLTVIPDLLVDAPFSGGGNPNVKQPAAPPPQPRVQPQPQVQSSPPAPAPTRTPPPPEKSAKPEPPAPEPSKPSKPSDEPDFTKPATGKHVPQVNTKLSERKSKPRSKSSDSEADSDSNAEERAQAKAAADARRRAQRAFSGALAGISGVVSSSTTVDIPGSGGEAFASYSQVVKSIYTQAWIEPREVNDDSATVKASVTIRRDGTVEEARIIQPSGNAAVDASVGRTLKSVDYVRPFPVGSKDPKRTFIIRFDLKAKRQLG